MGDKNDERERKERRRWGEEDRRMKGKKEEKAGE